MHKTKGFREIALTTAFLSLCGFREDLQADPSLASSNDQQQTLDQSNEKDRKAVISYTEALSVQNVQGTWGSANPPHEFNSTVLVTADLLYVVAEEDNLDFASKLVTNSTNNQSKETFYQPHFHWNLGSRVGISYLFEQFDGWDLDLNWTYIHGKGKNSATAPNPNIDITSLPLTDLLYPSWGGPATDTGVTGGFFVNGEGGTGVSSASVNWMLNMNLIDLHLARSFYISRKITLHPYVGLRGALIDQDYRARYESIYGVPPFTGSAQMKAKNDFKGLGIHGGFDFLWHFTPNWGVSALVSGSLIYGTFHIKQDYLSNAAFNDSLSPTEFITRRHLHQIRSNIEGALGLYWEIEFNQRRNRISMGLYYELSEWFDQNQMTRPFMDVDPVDTIDFSGGPILSDTRYDAGNLSYAGGSFRMRFDF